jgi:hypothetical protein
LNPHRKKGADWILASRKGLRWEWNNVAYDLLNPFEDSHAGGFPMSKSRYTTQRRAGLRADELEPGENSNVEQTSDEATGSPTGGLGSSGLAGLPDGDGAPGNAELSDIDQDAENEPQSGRAGGAVGGTPARKRRSGS